MSTCKTEKLLRSFSEKHWLTIKNMKLTITWKKSVSFAINFTSIKLYLCKAIVIAINY